MKNGRNENETGWPPWATILVVAILLGAFIWQAVPRQTIYLGIGIAVVIIGGTSYFVYRKRGIGPFRTIGKKIYESLKVREQETQKPSDVAPPLTDSEANDLINVVGNECENPTCHEKYNLAVHLIKPRAEGGSNKLNNLIVLCPNCHALADKGEPSQARLRRWIFRPKRFRYRLRWKWG
jgi:5-methylcytosine-specific restriction endonuclease McrA